MPKSSRKSRPSGKHSTKEPWSAWVENPKGGEYRCRRRLDGEYDYEYRPLQVASPDETHYSPEDEESEDEERGRSWEHDPDIPVFRAPSTGSDKTVQPPPPKPPFQKPSSTYSTPPGSPQQYPSASSPAYIYTAAAENKATTSRSLNADNDETWMDEPFYVDVEDQIAQAIVTPNEESFVTHRFAKRLGLPEDNLSHKRTFAHPLMDVRAKAKKRVEAVVGFNGQQAKSQKLYILPKELQLDGDIFLGTKVVGNLQTLKTDTRGVSSTLPLRGSTQATASQHGQADKYQTSYTSVNSGSRIEQRFRYSNSIPVDEYDSELERSQSYGPPPSEEDPQQLADSTEYEYGKYDSSGNTAHSVDSGYTDSGYTDSGFTASSSSDYSYGAHTQFREILLVKPEYVAKHFRPQ
ncbi:hypothetical protein EG329_007345 [Mollisiaceae sp. DMI_Dod_QoI]|nr:hypothetical protein EG329_007345 [Helotiales sp. DMI_Dod_QoI]